MRKKQKNNIFFFPSDISSIHQKLLTGMLRAIKIIYILFSCLLRLSGVVRCFLTKELNALSPKIRYGCRVHFRCILITINYFEN